MMNSVDIGFTLMLTFNNNKVYLILLQCQVVLKADFRDD